MSARVRALGLLLGATAIAVAAAAPAHASYAFVSKTPLVDKTAPDTSQPPSLSASSNPQSTTNWVVNQLAYYVPKVTNGKPPYAFTYTGTAPDGMYFEPTDGSFADAPTTAGTYNVTETVTDAEGRTATMAVTFNVTDGSGATGGGTTTGGGTGGTGTTTQASTGSMTPAGATCSGSTKTILTGNITAVVGQPIDLSGATVCNGAGPYVYEPDDHPQFDVPGLSINAFSGELTGTPTQAGTYTETLWVFDNNNAYISSQPFTVTVSAH